MLKHLHIFFFRNRVNPALEFMPWFCNLLDINLMGYKQLTIAYHLQAAFKMQKHSFQRFSHDAFVEICRWRQMYDFSI